jgi:hypothetical protein
MFVGLGGCDCRLQMDTARRTDTDDVEVIALEHFTVVRIAVYMICIYKSSDVVGISGTDSD